MMDFEQELAKPLTPERIAAIQAAAERLDAERLRPQLAAIEAGEIAPPLL